jgi:Arc/MetJ-type ribon-helix-helix transcriptional regulator
LCMTTITVRLSQREKEELGEHGKVSEVVREALRLYLRTKNSKRLISRLRELQKSQPRTRIAEDVRLIRADRER